MSACQFDEGGIPAVSDSAISGLTDGRQTDGASPIDASLPPDATLQPCVDSDGDTFLIVNVSGANCAGPLDCDDGDGDAFPGQESYYDHERTSGGYDYNCDGSESLFDTTEGGDCQSEWWECLGTGWVNGVPMCGGVGTWHSCEDVSGGCQETTRVMANMLCR